MNSRWPRKRKACSSVASTVLSKWDTCGGYRPGGWGAGSIRNGRISSWSLGTWTWLHGKNQHWTLDFISPHDTNEHLQKLLCFGPSSYNNSFNSMGGRGLLLDLIYSWGNWGPESLNILSSITQLSSRVKSWAPELFPTHCTAKMGETRAMWLRTVVPGLGSQWVKPSLDGHLGLEWCQLLVPS